MSQNRTAITADGTTSFTNLRPGGRYVLWAVGTSFGSGTLTINWSDGTTAVQFTNGSLTANGAIEVVMPLNQVDFVMTGSSSPSVTVGVTPVLDRR